MAVKRSSPSKSASSSSSSSPSPPSGTSTPRPTRARAVAKPATPRRAAPATKSKAAAKTVGRAPRKAVAPKPTHAATRATRASKARAQPTLQQVVLDALADMKAVDVKALDVRGVTDITDTMVVASGTSDRHVKSIADRVVQRCKEAGFRPYGMEGERDGEWVLLDLQDLVLHVMLPRVREFYALEKLWEGGATARRA
jgi:ribosome-associated protein